MDQDPGGWAARHGPGPVSGHGSPAPGPRVLRPGHLLRGRRLRGTPLRGPGGTLGSRSRAAGRAGLYIHFPFCEAKCPYCHFYSVPWSAAGCRAWLEALGKEAETAAAEEAAGLRFDTLYVGGGTPSLLEADDVSAILDLASSRFRLEMAEFTLEANPGRGAAEERLKGWREAGVTRLSVGAQSFDDGILRRLGRMYGAAEAVAFCRSARAAGFESLSVDLMIGVPGEMPETVGRTIETLIGLEPDQVSLYFLVNVEDLPFAKVLEKRPVDEDAAVESYERASAALEAAGLRRYEISNFARPGQECLHNLKYWRYEPYLGLGPSACSHVELRRWCN
ncbi:MAG: radical SAM family heme chaperone HemW, partial [Candidatus Aminicenantes bacterium]|nr:radical SAM family heme chaperone HemW [Candidatus Aminicenantes bacterium]